MDEERVAARNRLVSALNSAARGDASALRRVYDLTSAKLFGICLRICGDREAAEDILQDVYVKVWRRASAFDPERASPISWLAMIARNASIDWLRREGRHAADGAEALALVADERPSADAQMGRDEDSRRLHACLDGLQGLQADVIRRAFLQGLTYPQLAETTGRPLGTIKSLARRGLEKLKVCLGDG